MPINTKLLLGGAAALAFLFSSKGSSKGSSKASDTNSDKTDPEKKPNEEVKPKGGLGDPVGPEGCDVGLSPKDGICVKPTNAPKKEPPYNGLASADSMYVSADCKVVKFGDKTGDAWWKSKGKPKALQWIETKDYKNPLMIAYRMIHSLSPCFKEFPIQENYNTRNEMEHDRVFWIKNNREVWNLLWSIRNRIDKEFFNGEQTIELDLKTLKISYGKKFNFEILWESFLLPFAGAAVEIEMITPGTLFKGDLLPKQYQGGLLFDEDYVWTVSTFLQFVILSNITNTNFFKLYNAGAGKVQVFNTSSKLFTSFYDHVDAAFGQDEQISIEFDFEET